MVAQERMATNHVYIWKDRWFSAIALDPPLALVIPFVFFLWCVTLTLLSFLVSSSLILSPFFVVLSHHHRPFLLLALVLLFSFSFSFFFFLFSSSAQYNWLSSRSPIHAEPQMSTPFTDATELEENDGKRSMWLRKETRTR